MLGVPVPLPGVLGVGARWDCCRAHEGEWDARLFVAEDERHRSNAFVDPVPLLLAASRQRASDFTEDPSRVEMDPFGVVTKGARGPSCQSLSPVCLESRGLSGVADGVTVAAVVARLLRSRGVTGVSCLPANKGTNVVGVGDAGLPRIEGDVAIGSPKVLRSPGGAARGCSIKHAAAVSWSISCDGSHADMRVMSNGITGPSCVGDQGICNGALSSAALSGCSCTHGGDGCATGKSLRISRSGIGGDNGEPGVPSRSCNSFGVGGWGDKQALGTALCTEGLIDALVADAGRAEVSAEASDSASADVARGASVGVFNSSCSLVDAASAHAASGNNVTA